MIACSIGCSANLRQVTTALVASSGTVEVSSSGSNKFVAASAPAASEEPEFDPDDDDVGPPPPPPGQNLNDEDDDEEPEFDVSDEESDLPAFPTTHELVMKDHTKVVSALAMDPSGARFVSGSHDYDCKLWDFGGMDFRCKPFKTWEPAGTYYVRLLSCVVEWHILTSPPS